MNIRVREVLFESVHAFIFWMIVAIPVALSSAILSAWPANLRFPWQSVVVSFIGIFLGITVLWVYQRLKVESPSERARALSVVRTTVIGFIIALVFGFLPGAAWVLLTNEPRLEWKLVLIVSLSVVGGIVSFALFGITYKSRWVSKHIAIIWDRKSRKSIVLGIVFSLVIGILCMLFWYVIFSDRDNGFLISIIDNPGGVFAFIIGVATLAGVYMTIMSIAELGKTITTFPELIRRLISLVEGTMGEGEYVRYLCYTPLTGSWAVPEYLWKRFYDLMVDSTHEISLVTLSKSDLREWYLSFVGRTTSRGFIGPDKASKAITESERVITLLDSQASSEGRDRLKPVRLRFHQMPGFYFFSNEERAIIVSPVFLPLPRGTSKETQIHKLESVQVVGIETVDPGVVSWINKLHDVYRIDVSKVTDFLETGEAALDQLSNELCKIMPQAENFAKSIIAEKGEGKVAFRLHVYACEENEFVENHLS